MFTIQRHHLFNKELLIPELLGEDPPFPWERRDLLKGHPKLGAIPVVASGDKVLTDGDCDWTRPVETRLLGLGTPPQATLKAGRPQWNGPGCVRACAHGSMCVYLRGGARTRV